MKIEKKEELNHIYSNEEIKKEQLKDVELKQEVGKKGQLNHIDLNEERKERTSQSCWFKWRKKRRNKSIMLI